MKQFQKRIVEEEFIESVNCNQCTKVIDYEDEDVFEAEVSWGYNSKWDGFAHAFDLCQACYQKLIDSFLIPVCVGKIEGDGSVVEPGEN